MKYFRAGFARNLCCVALLSLLAALTGCETAKPSNAALSGPPPDIETVHIGDHIRVDFTGRSGAGAPIDPVESQINDQGMISLPRVGPVKVADMKPREIETLIHDKYVPDLYLVLTVTVHPQDRFFIVGGDVRLPSRYAYSSGMTVTKAIQTAGGFTDFGNKRNVRLRRSNATSDIVVNVKKAIENPQYDYPVYPGDSIMVRRRLY